MLDAYIATDTSCVLDGHVASLTTTTAATVTTEEDDYNKQFVEVAPHQYINKKVYNVLYAFGAFQPKPASAPQSTELSVAIKADDEKVPPHLRFNAILKADLSDREFDELQRLRQRLGTGVGMMRTAIRKSPTTASKTHRAAADRQKSVVGGLSAKQRAVQMRRLAAISDVDEETHEATTEITRATWCQDALSASILQDLLDRANALWRERANFLEKITITEKDATACN